MGQYHYVINLDRREYLHPHRAGDGLKLMEFGASGGGGTMLMLALLLSDSNGRGLGDFGTRTDGPNKPEDEYLVGRWAGQRIVVTGDYADKNNWQGVAFITEREREAWQGMTLYELTAEPTFTDITLSMRALFAACGESDLLRARWDMPGQVGREPWWGTDEHTDAEG